MSLPLLCPTLLDIDIECTGWISRLKSYNVSLSPSSVSISLHSSVIPSRALLSDHFLQAVVKLYISDCTEAMPAGGMLELAALEDLQLQRCQELLASDKEEQKEEEEEGLGILPSSLASLAVQECYVTYRWLSRCLQGLTSLSTLTILACEGLQSLPEGSLVGCLQGLPTLSTLTIDFCTPLASLPHLRRLTIQDCQLESATEVLLPHSLQLLEISRCYVTDGWMSRCLQGLIWLSTLKIWSCTGLTSLPSAPVLRRLPALQALKIGFCDELTSLGGLHALDSLKQLIVTYCSKLESLPEEGLPASIEHLCLEKCHPALQQQICQEEGPEWNKVAHFPFNPEFVFPGEESACTISWYSLSSPPPPSL